MRFSTALPILALAAGLVNAQNNNNQNQNQNQNQGGNGGNNNVLLLNPNNVQNTSDGLADAEPGQAASDTDPANFINLCTGKTLTDGLQNQQGSCNPIPMGDIPAKNKMISAIFVNPKNNDDLPANTDINFQVQLLNLEAGSFTNPDDTYYAAPQALGNGGTVIGHTHITVQDMGQNFESGIPPDPTIFAFFKGVNDDGNGQGLLSADLAKGLAKGNYRVCSMTSASNHQPVLMPVAQRGAQDDCRYFTVGGGVGQSAVGGGQAGGQGGGQQGGQGGGQQSSQAAGGAASSTGAAAQASAVAGNGQGGNGQGGGKGQRFGKGGQRFGRPRKFTAREFVA